MCSVAGSALWKSSGAKFPAALPSVCRGGVAARSKDGQLLTSRPLTADERTADSTARKARYRPRQPGHGASRGGLNGVVSTPTASTEGTCGGEGACELSWAAGLRRGSTTV
jgi:hypothetical protein